MVHKLRLPTVFIVLIVPVAEVIVGKQHQLLMRCCISLLQVIYGSLRRRCTWESILDRLRNGIAHFFLFGYPCQGCIYIEVLGVAQGETAEREKNIRALEGLLEPGVIAEKFELPLDYVLKVMNHEAACTMQVREPDVEYVAVKKQ